MSAEPIGYHCFSCGQVGAWKDLVRHPSGGLGCPECLTTEGVAPLLHRPRCSTCKWWGKDREGRVGDREDKQQDWRQCWRITEPDSLAQGGYDETMTACDFGCIQWEPKERSFE